MQSQQPPKTPTPGMKRDSLRGRDSSGNPGNCPHSSGGVKPQLPFGQCDIGRDGNPLQRAHMDQIDPFYTGPKKENPNEQKSENPFRVSHISLSNRRPSSPKFFLPEQLLRDSPYPYLKHGGVGRMKTNGSQSAGLRPDSSTLKSPDPHISHNDYPVPSHSEMAALVDIAVKYGAAQNQLEVLSEKTTASEKEVETYKAMLQSSIAERDEALANANALRRRIRELEATVRSMSIPATPTHHCNDGNGVTGCPTGPPQTPTFTKFTETSGTALSVHKPPIRTETPVLKTVVQTSHPATLATRAMKSPPTSDLRQQPYRGLLSDYFESIEKWGEGYARLTISRMGSLNPFVRSVTAIMGNWRGSDDLINDLPLRGFVIAAIINRRIGEATMAEDIFKTYDVLKHQQNMELVDRWNNTVAQAKDSAIKRSIIDAQVSLFDAMYQEEKYRYWRKDKAEDMTNSLMDIFNSLIHETHRKKAFEDLRELIVKGYRIAMRMRREHKKWDFNFPGAGSQYQKDNMVVRNHNMLGDLQTTLMHARTNPDGYKVLLGVSPAIVQVDYTGNAVVTEIVHYSEVLIMRKR